MHIKNFEKYGHYTDGRPMHWIKVMKTLMDDRQWHALSGDAAKLLIGLWLLAIEGKGMLPDLETTAFRLRTDAKKADKLLDELVHWIVRDDEVCTELYETVPNRCLELEIDIDKIREDKEGDISEITFNAFWNAYPDSTHKSRKQAAFKKWQSRKLHKIADDIMQGLECWKSSKNWLEKDYIHNPANWLEGKMWNERPGQIEVKQEEDIDDENPF